MVYTISQIACIEREWPLFVQWHRIWLTPSYIEYIALTTAVPFNTGYLSAVSSSRQLKAALQFFSHYKVPLTFWYSWKRLRKRRSKNLIKFPQVYIAFVLQYVHCFEKNNTYWLNESWETRLPKRLKCTIVALSECWSTVKKVADNKEDDISQYIMRTFCDCPSTYEKADLHGES